MNELKQGAIDAVTSPKTAGTVMATTAATGLSESFITLPWTDIASCIGSILSIVLGIIQIWRFILDREKRLAEIRILEKQEHNNG